MASFDGNRNHLKTRRDFLEFMGRTTMGLSATLPALPLLSGCTGSAVRPSSGSSKFLKPETLDDVKLAPGLQYSVVAKWGDVINPRGDQFGINCDYLAFFADAGTPTSGHLWVNHEFTQPLFVSGYTGKEKRTQAQVEKEMDSVGGSWIRIKKDPPGGWRIDSSDQRNRRLTGRTPIPFSNGAKIAGKTVAVGTTANCAGGVTPWGTVLTCEENFDDCYGDIDEQGRKIGVPSKFGWESVFPFPPEHYGWVNEFDPQSGKVRKLISLGRFAHECATTTEAADGRCVIYMADDAADQCIYKWISDKPRDLSHGELFVADTERGEWRSLDREKNSALKKAFKTQTDLLIQTRKAAAIAGGTPLDRPEDVEIDPVTKNIFIALTNNPKKGNYHGSILKLEEADKNPLSMKFKASTFLAGGMTTGFSCPDNLVFDRRGNLWMTNDISDKFLGRGPYEPFQNNALFYIPLSGPQAGTVHRVATAPMDSEFAGPNFSPDGKTLFLSVQHPGVNSKSLAELTSHWPDRGSSLPRSAVIAIEGPLLTELTGG